MRSTILEKKGKMERRVRKTVQLLQIHPNKVPMCRNRAMKPIQSVQMLPLFWPSLLYNIFWYLPIHSKRK